MIINHCLTVFIRVIIVKFIVNDSNIDKGFGSICKSVMPKKNFFGKDWIVKMLLEHGIEIFEC